MAFGKYAPNAQRGAGAGLYQSGSIALGTPPSSGLYWQGIQELIINMRRTMNLLETYRTDIFNSNSRGTITMGTRNQKAYKATSWNWNRLGRKTQFRDPELMQDIPDQLLTEYSTSTIKFAMRWGPDLIDVSSGDFKGVTMAEMGSVRGAQIAAENVGFRAQCAIHALVGAFGASGLGALLTDKSKAAAGGSTAIAPDDESKMKFEHFLDARSVLGDMYGDVRVWIMHSKPWHDMAKVNASNSNRFFGIDSLRLSMFDGVPIVITDNPALVIPAVTGSGARAVRYRALGLRPMAMRIDRAGEFREHQEYVLGQSNIMYRMQEQDACVLEIKNMKFNGAKLAVNEFNTGTTFTELAKAANWSVGIGGTVDIKDYFGVQLITN